MTGKLGVAGYLLIGCALTAAARPVGAAVPARHAEPADTTRLEAGDRTQQERWSAPFAVTSRGRTAPRTERAVVVLRDSAARAARAEPPPAAAGPAPTASPAASGSAPATPPATAAARGSAGSGRAAAVPPAATPPPARTAPPRTSATAAATTRTHRLEWGDTWYAIARQYGVSSRDLAAANPAVDPEKLVSGTVLRIPGAAAGAARRTHRVEAGESLWGIARRYGVSTDALRRANKLEDDRVRIGATLVIPGGD